MYSQRLDETPNGHSNDHPSIILPFRPRPQKYRDPNATPLRIVITNVVMAFAASFAIAVIAVFSVR